MCTNYTPNGRPSFLADWLGVAQLPQQPWPEEVFPGYAAPIVVLEAGKPGHEAGQGDAPQGVVARFGLVPRWCKDAAQAKDMGRRTYNARSETAATKPSFRGPWRDRHWVLIPMDNFYEPCWEDAAAHGGHSVRWRIARADAQPFAVAGLWEHWVDPVSGEITASFTLLTVNADGHPLMGRMHRPGDEKRMPAIIAPGQYQAWLHASPDEAHHLLHTTPASDLVGTPAPRTGAAAQQGASRSLF